MWGSRDILVVGGKEGGGPCGGGLLMLCGVLFAVFWTILVVGLNFLM